MVETDMQLALLPVLSPQEIACIHERSLDLLERTGVQYNSRRALEILEERGCRVDYERSWASLPPDLVEWALQQAPRVVRLGGRDPSRDVILDGRSSHHTTDSQGTEAIDFETGERRNSTLYDLQQAVRFADALDMIEIVNVSVSASDVEAPMRVLRQFAAAFSGTNKHVRSGVYNPIQAAFLVELAKAAAGSDAFHPIFSVVDCTISPLMHDGPMTDACIDLAKLGTPIMIYPMPMAGGTSPVTAAGTILVHNIEFLSGLALLQCVRPGTEIIYGLGASQLDMKTGRYGGSASGYALRLALGAMPRYYHLPCNIFGLSTSSSWLDAQYGHEATAAGLLAYLNGVDEIYSAGLLEDAQVLSLDKMVLDNQLARQLKRMIQPARIDELHLGAELIERVGIGGHFLSQPETRAFTRQEYVPKWPAGGRSVLESVREEALEIFHCHRSPVLPQGAESRMEAILKEAGETLAS
jgi:trimethylamine--corrinoid protein Co-methyltransferase